MTGIPRGIRWTVGLGLLGLVLTVPFSSPDGTGMQWDELVLGIVAGITAWSTVRLTRGMDASYARAWRVVAVGAALFMTAQLLAGLFPGPAFDGFGADDVLLFLGASSPVVTCALLARQVRRTRWATLVLDGTVVTVALLVVTEVLRTPLVDAADARGDLSTLVLTYGGYAAVMLGGAGALCTVSTAALRRSATVMIGAVACQAAAACTEVMAVVAPSTLWTAMSGVSVVLGLQAVVLAATYAPKAHSDRSARAAAPRVSPVGMALVVVAMFGVPVAVAQSLIQGRAISDAADVGIAVVLALIAVRLGLRIREDGRVSEDLVRNEEDFRTLVESSSDGVAIVDDELRLLFTSPAARDMLGLVPDDAHDRSLLDLIEPEDRALVRASIEDSGDGGPVLHFRVAREDGGPGELEATTTVRPGSDRRVLYLRDVTSRRSRERELERMAYTDHLTALPNRAHLFEEMAAPGGDEPRSLLVLDLDGFKAVNDVAGHEAGDQLLVEVARRLHTVVREDDLVARLGGDEFAVLVAGPPDEAAEAAQRIVDALGMPHRVGDWTFAVGASVGIAALGAGGGQLAFRDADAALREAKQAGKGCVRIATDGVSSPAADRDLPAALVDGWVRLSFSAACDADGRIELVHAVPVGKDVAQRELRGQDLWAAAERQGRSADLQRWLLQTACAAVADLPGDRVDVVVSLPAGHVTADGLAAEVATALAASGLAPSRLNLSITEETLLTSSPVLVPELTAVRGTGVRLCLDNYGMGHTLFSILPRIALDAVRVDLAALAARDDTGRSLQVLAAIAHTAAAFGLTMIAGGITTPELRDAAVAAGVDLVHGRNQPYDLTAAALAGLLTGVPAG